MKRFFLGFILIFGTVQLGAQEADDLLDLIILPDGFEISYFAEGVHAPRSLTVGDNGTVFAGMRNAMDDQLYAFVDADADGVAEEIIPFAQDFVTPNGVVFYAGDLYAATTTTIYRFEDIEANLDNIPDPIIIYDDLPDNAQHGWRFIDIGPDGRLYITVGAPCNICIDYDPDIFSLMLSMTPDGDDVRIEARGIRSSYGFAWQPETDLMFFSENGRDWVSDDLPPDEINVLRAPDLNFGYPYCHGGYLEDIDFPHENACEGTEPPIFQLPAHVAPLGITFYDGDQFPEAYRGRLFIAEHGSRNRSTAVGYRVTILTFDETGEVINYEPFVEGFLQGTFGTDAWGRPADLLVMPDGSLLISDDFGDAIYRITYTDES